MKFSAYLPPQARTGKVPVLYFLSGLTCTEETFAIKSHAQQMRGGTRADADRAGHEPARAAHARAMPISWDFGYSAGFYVDATEAPWSQNYRMYSYVTRELPRARRGASSGTRRRDRHLRPFHGRPWRADTGAAQSARCTDRSRHSRRSRRRCNVPGARRPSATIWGRIRRAWREYDATRTGGAPAVSRARS